MNFSAFLNRIVLAFLCLAIVSVTACNKKDASTADPGGISALDSNQSPPETPTAEEGSNTSQEKKAEVPEPSTDTDQATDSIRLARIIPIATKMNIVYVGIENPIELAGVSDDEENISVVFEKGNVRKVSSSKYIITSRTVGAAKMTIRRGNLPPVESTFYVKPFPNPVAMLGYSQGGSMSTGEFKVQGGVSLQLPDFNFDAECNVVTFKISRRDEVTVRNAGARYNAAAKRLVFRAIPGDIYYYTDVRVKCPGDINPRTINSMVFKIK